MVDNIESLLREHKIKIIDTCAILSDPNSFVNGFIPQSGTNVLIIPQAVIGELENLKSSHRIGTEARSAIRSLEGLSLYEGSELNSGEGTTIVISDIRVLKSIGVEGYDGLPKFPFMQEHGADRILLGLASFLAEHNCEVEIVTNDTALRVHAESQGLKAENWKRVEVIGSLDEIYKGWVNLPEGRGYELKRLVKNSKRKYLTLNKAREFNIFQDRDPYPNEFIILFPEIRYHNNSINSEFWALRWNSPDSDSSESEGRFLPLWHAKNSLVKPLNPWQACLMELLYDPNITLVTAIGEAGTGKTFLALEAALNSLGTLEQILGNEMAHEMKNAGFVKSNNKDHLVVTRSVEYETTGYLPGGIDEKMNPYMLPVLNNFIRILRAKGVRRDQAENLWREIYGNDIEVFHPSMLRGVSLTDTILLVEEAQNSNSHMAETAITRVGENSEIIFTGDPTQIDIMGITPTNNALVYVHQSHRGDPTSGNIVLPRESVVRSERVRMSLKLLEEYRGMRR